MPLEEKKYDIEANNDWAKNVKGEHLYIDDAQSGRKAGYFCIGCDKQMDAVIRKKNPKYRSYFRHVPIDISKDETPCTFSNRKYREILATDILQRLKSIKVPSVYKYPPKGEDGAPMLLNKVKYVTANKVKSQLTFYEDSEGAVKFGKNPEIEDRYLLIRPDVVFFDVNDIPILLIELVVTHKVNEEKKIKLRRLGIDTVSIIIPKSTEQEIEDNFKTTKRVKWEYNGDEANTKYVRVPSGTSERVLEFDADQRRIFEESNACRKARLNNTLRTFKKCLQSESYRRAKRDFESEISRIEKATKAEQQRLDDMEARIDQEVRGELAERIRTIKNGRSSISEEESRFREYSEDLENRYHSKDRELREEESRINSLIQEQFSLGDSSEDIEGKFKEAGRNLEEEFYHKTERVRQDIERDTRSLEKLRIEEGNLPNEFKHLEKREHKEFAETSRKLETKRNEIESKINSFEEYTERTKNELDIEFKIFREQAIKRINKRDTTGDSQLSKRIETILNAGRITAGFNERLKTYERYKAYLELARGGTWKK